LNFSGSWYQYKYFELAFYFGVLFFGWFFFKFLLNFESFLNFVELLGRFFVVVSGECGFCVKFDRIFIFLCVNRCQVMSLKP